MDWVNTDQSPKFEPEDRSSRRVELVWNVLTLLVLMAVVGIVVVYIYVFANPNAAINPFPPPTLPALIVLPSSTPTVKAMPPTWTPSPMPTATATPAPPTPVVGTDAVEVSTEAVDATPAATEQPRGLYAFDLQGEVKSIDATIFRQEHGCKWMGLAGQAFDMQGRPATGITVQVGGTLGRSYIDLISLTGTALWYGQAGYEVFLADKPTESKGTMWVRLLDQSGLPLSAKVYFPTSSDCMQNLAVINFKQVR